MVELVTKLQDLGLLGDDLLHSVNGREYLTRDRLVAEVGDAVASAGGRAALVDLPAALGVDLVHCEKAAASAVAASGGDLRLVQGDVVSTAYFDALAAEVGELLEDAGSLGIGELARRFNLGADALQAALVPRLGTLVKGRLEGGVLHTPAHAARAKAALRGALRGAAAPVNLGTLAKALGISAAGGATAGALVEELVAEGALAGSLRAGAVWTPDVHSRAQEAGQAAFYAQNGFIECARGPFRGASEIGMGGVHVLARYHARPHPCPLHPPCLLTKTRPRSPQIRHAVQDGCGRPQKACRLHLSRRRGPAVGLRVAGRRCACRGGGRGRPGPGGLGGRGGRGAARPDPGGRGRPA